MKVIWQKLLFSLPFSLLFLRTAILPVLARSPDKIVECEILIIGGGLAGVATAYESLRDGRTVCMTEITDWVGGQISAQGTSALDEKSKQRSLLFYPQGYNELRIRIEKKYGRLDPGECWVSESCFLPKDAHKILTAQLQQAAKRGRGTLHWFPNTVIKDLEISPQGNIIQSAIAIQHQPKPNTPPLNQETLSQTIEDAYTYTDSSRFSKTIIQFLPKLKNDPSLANWYIIDATETGEIIALADVPYRLGIDPLSSVEPSSSGSITQGNPYCTQGFTYTFAMEKMAATQTYDVPAFYSQYEPYYSYELSRFASIDLLFSYRRIWSPKTGEMDSFGGIRWSKVTPGDISMQNWTWGNDYRPGTERDNLIYTRSQLQQMGQLQSGQWLGGLRTETLRKGEENAIGFFYWLVQGTTDSRLGAGVKQGDRTHRYLTGLDSPMGTMHGLSKYPYIREGRRIIGRPSFAYPEGFMVTELDISAKNYRDEYYQNTLPGKMYREMWTRLAGLGIIDVIMDDIPTERITRRTRSTLYPDSVGIAQYNIDFHPCMTLSPPELPGNTEREGTRQGAGLTYPAQIPLRAMIPQKVDNLLVAGKSIATSHIAAAAYRVHSFEWSVGAAAGMTATYALETNIMPYQLVETMPRSNPQLQELKLRLVERGNPNAFPDASIFNLDWDAWK
ncbi:MULTISPECIES: FAD-dependent oxidoreductase [Spirulina sp. CCY15215]|uniref:FAD-dependent oxidoreductase n=1 Tax=Spirulina sp. CCY15215 TaxID=2767591 RepID=UPI0019518B05|nr:FAD-dependent oxidoreductase [Spirulina major]